MIAVEGTVHEQKQTAVHLPSLIVALMIMMVGTIYPLVFAHSDGTADHRFAFALFWAMSAGLVRGVGFLPRAIWWKFLFSGWSCIAALLLAAWIRWGL